MFKENDKNFNSHLEMLDRIFYLRSSIIKKN